MSEYQFVHFLALDRPLDKKQLAFMGRQSTRARITPREFTNEYHYGDFRGNRLEMLRRGYDVHLHYANFGVRLLMIRLPAGLPCDEATYKAFAIDEMMEWTPDKNGPGGILSIEPEADAGTYDQEVLNVRPILRKIAAVRELLQQGDLRPLYLAWLACVWDKESREPPVPAGLNELTPGLIAMARFYELRPSLIAAAAETSPPLPASASAPPTTDWIARQSRQDLEEMVARLLKEEPDTVRAEMLTKMREESRQPGLPCAEPSRTLAELHKAAQGVAKRRAEKKRKAQEQARGKRLAAIARDPDKTIARVERLIGQRGYQSYKQAAEELVDLREALGPDRGPAETRAVAERLRAKYPRGQFKRIFRDRGLLE